MPEHATDSPERAVDPRDEAVVTEVAYRMQSAWTGEDMQRACVTAAMLAREALAAEIRAAASPSPSPMLSLDDVKQQATRSGYFAAAWIAEGWQS